MLKVIVVLREPILAMFRYICIHLNPHLLEWNGVELTRVEVHTVKPEFMQWRIDYATPEGLVLLRDVMGQFILWHKRDIILTASSPSPKFGASY